MACFRTFSVERLIPAAHIDAINAFIASLPPQGHRSFFVQSSIDAIERKLASLQSS